MNTCETCNGKIERARVKLGLTRCLSCAQKNPVARKKGCLTWMHKTGGVIEIFDDPKKFKVFKSMDRSRGRGAGFGCAASTWVPPSERN